VQRFCTLLQSEEARTGLTRLGFQVPAEMGTVISKSDE